MSYRTHIGANAKGRLTIGGVDTITLAEEFGTPLYVVDEGRIRERYREFYSAFSSLYPKVEIKYAYKANTSLSVCKILKDEGAGADIVSGGELYIAKLIGLPSKDIIFTGNNKSDEEMEAAIDAGIIINIDAMHELERLKEMCEKKGRSVRISFRINPAVSPETHPHLSTGLKESKFGIHVDKAVEAYETALDSEYLEIAGIHMHIGSQIQIVGPYEEATSELLDVVGKLKKRGIDLEFIDLGGGIGIRYREEEPYITPEDVAKAVVPIIKRKIEEYDLKEPVLYLEPGRFIVGDSAIMLAKAGTIKKTPYKKFVSVDAGFHIFFRPMMYSAYHEAIVANKVKEDPQEEVDIAGNICEAGDILAKDRNLPRIEKDDVIAFLDAGAYCLASASQYNSRPRSAEVLVNNGEYELIRERETLEDITAKQRIPKRLK